VVPPLRPGKSGTQKVSTSARKDSQTSLTSGTSDHERRTTTHERRTTTAKTNRFTLHKEGIKVRAVRVLGLEGNPVVTTVSQLVIWILILVSVLGAIPHPGRPHRVFPSVRPGPLSSARGGVRGKRVVLFHPPPDRHRLLVTLPSHRADPDTLFLNAASVKKDITKNFTWLYIGAQNVWVFFIAYLWLNPKYADIRLGRKDEKPEFSSVSWFLMMFMSAGAGTGLVFYGVGEPVYHLSYNRYVAKGTMTYNELSQEAINLTYYHWGVHAWMCYTIVALSQGIVSHRMGLPLTIRSCFFPIFGTKIFEWCVADAGGRVGWFGGLPASEERGGWGGSPPRRPPSPLGR